MLREKVKCTREELKCEGRKRKDYGGQNRHKKLRRKIKGYGEKSKGADRVKGENKMHG